ncbi:hypothetical protein [Brachybacterium tyrofermentans]|uniref:hypothetical protein n=1 Tax=Brachybacterium tyrofermentans TaxID=47848 RepID=UPI003FB75306
MSGWTEARPENADDGPGPGEVPEGTPGAVPIRFEVDLFGRRVPVAWTVPTEGAREHWDARRTGPNMLEHPFE